MSRNLPQGWEEKRLSEVCENVSITHKFKKEDKVVFVNTGDVLEGKFLHKDFKRIKDLPGQAKKLIQKNDILFSEIRPKNKRYAFVEKDLNEYVVSTKFMVIRNFKNIIPTYLYLFLTSENILEVCQTIAESRSGTFPQITFDSIRYEKILIPQDINEQKRIADILSAFDDKIELNNQMNQTLESMATALFKEWFENFNFPNDEGKAYKENGGEFKSSELGEIPIDWEVKKLSDISENISRRFKLNEYEKVVFVNTGDVLNGEFLHKEYKSSEGLPGQAKKAIKEGDILYSEIRPKNRRFARVDKDVNDYVVSTKFMVIKRNDKIGYNCLYIFLTLDSTIEEINTIAESRSGTFPQITFDSISNIKIVLPNNNLIIDSFENIVNPIFKQIKLNKEQNQTLKKQRDTLLPKLMSGEIRI